MASLYRRGMTSDVFAWVPASNNNAFLAGRISLAFNAISILRTAEGQNPTLARNTAILPIPRGPKQALGLEHVMGVYTIWKFAQEKALAKKYIRDQQLQYIGHFLNSKFYNFPAWPKAVPNIKKKLQRGPERQVHRPRQDLADGDDQRRLPGLLERGDRRGVQHLPDPADVRPGRTGQQVGRGVRSRHDQRGAAHLQEVARQGEDLGPA